MSAPARAVLAVPVLFLLAAALGVATGPRRTGPGLSIDPGVSSTLFYSLLGVAVGVELLVVALIIRAFWPTSRRREGRKDDKLLWLATLVIQALVLSVVLLGLRWRQGQVVPAGSPAQPGLNLGAPPPLVTSSATAGPAALAPDASQLAPFALGVLLLLAVAAVLLLRERTRPTRGDEAREQPTVPSAAGFDAIDEALDPRLAVIAAYAAMEDAARSAELPRRRPEAPTEFAARLGSSKEGLSGDARRLALLFELAKFSRHLIDADMRREALGALDRLRARLRADGGP